MFRLRLRDAEIRRGLCPQIYVIPTAILLAAAANSSNPCGFELTRAGRAGLTLVGLLESTRGNTG